MLGASIPVGCNGFSIRLLSVFSTGRGSMRRKNRHLLDAGQTADKKGNSVVGGWRSRTYLFSLSS